MKLFRAFYYTVMVTALFYGLYSGNRLCYLLFFMQLLLMLFGAVLCLWTFFSFSFTQTLSTSQATKGERALLHLTVVNDKPFPFTHLKLHVITPDPADEQILTLNLDSHEETSFDLPLSLPLRGEFDTGITRVDIPDLFGLFTLHFDLRWLSWYHPRKMLVLPRVFPFQLSAVGGRSEGALRRTLSNDGSNDYSYLRNYVPGDSSSKIHWKSSLKMHTLLSRELDSASGESCLIFIDPSPVPQDRAADCPSMLYLSDALVEYAASITAAHRRKQDLTLLECGDPKVPSSDSAHVPPFTVLSQWLALLPFEQVTAEESANQLLALLTQYRPAVIYLLSAYPNESIIHLFRTLPYTASYWVASPLPDHGAPLPQNLSLVSFFEQEPALFLEAQARRLE